jgi:tetratricopeptide (TPR) repeat protein
MLENLRMPRSARVFISYAHEANDPAHGERVLGLADRLRGDGLESRLDQYVRGGPEKGWQLWMEDEIEAADFVLIVATETYERRRRRREEPGKGLGVAWEGAIIGQTLYRAALHNTRFILIIFDAADAAHVPVFLGDFPKYRVATEEGYEALVRRLTDQPEIEPPPVRDVRERPPRSRFGAGPAPPRISTAKLPSTGPTFVAREDELARLDAAWVGGTNVISFVALGGAGKSALVNRWLDQMQRDGWRGAERVLGWSFYREGTNSAGASSEAFVAEALDWLGYRGEPITSPWKKGEVLAGLVRQARTLLVLDGLEPLQHPPGAQTGRIKDPAVQALVKELAAENPGLCVITTRLAVADIAGRAETEAVDLEKLPAAAGAELLKRLGVEGSDKDLRAASEELRGHGLALTLLGTYLRDVYGGDVRKRREAAVLDEEIEGGEQARQVMASYENWFGPGAEVKVLLLLGLFDRPAQAAALGALRAAPEIPGLTEGIGVGEERAWKLALARLRQARLLAPAESGDTHDTGALDAHPLVREHFGERLRQTAPEAWRAGNERLYEHYQKVAPEYPETLEAMLPLYAAVVHGCRAGREQEALDEVFWRRIRRRSEGFSWRKLGAFGAELTALAAFFDRPWDLPSARFTTAYQAWLLSEAGFVLRGLGWLPEAIQPTRVSMEARIDEQDWEEAARSACNLSELTLTLGEVASAVAAGKESVELADRSGDVVMRMINRATLADALHQAGRWEKSAAACREAEAMQAELQPEYPRLYSIRGSHYCDVLLGRAEPWDGSGLDGVGTRYREACEEVRERAGETLEWAIRNRLSLLTIALDHLSLGRAHLGLALTAPAAPPDFRPAAEHLDQAVDGLRQAAQEDDLPRGLLARAALRRLASDFPAATADLREAQEIAERGSMRLFEADAHLEWTRLHLATGDPAAAHDHLDRARDLVRACAYGRREREVAWLERRLAESPAETGAS